MLKRQDSLISSTRRKTPPPAPEKRHVKSSIGCMSGIFQLISKYQNRTKRITFGKKQAKKSNSSSSSTTRRTKVVVVVDDVDHQQHETKDIIVPRSPTIPPEIRRPNNVKNSPENVKPPPSLVARLMGLEETTHPHIINHATTQMKRRMILQALDKCNEDLEELRKIINSVGSTEVVAVSGGATPQVVVAPLPSRVGLPDESTRSPLCKFVKAQVNGHIITQQKKPSQRILKRAEAYESVGTFKKPTNINEPFQDIKPLPVATTTSSSPVWCSKLAMIESVEEVCNDIEWGQKREVGRIGLGLQDHICRDLIEEVVKEMDFVSLHSLPFEACKRRLCF